MTPSTLLTRITDLTDIINDPQADNTAGRKEALRYEVLPKLLVDNLNLITTALKEKVEREEQPNLFN
jgi:transketolase